MKKPIYRTRTTTFHLDKEGIIHMTVEGSEDMGLDDAKENMNMITKLVQTTPRIILSDIRNVRSTTKEYRDYFTVDEVEKEISVIAVLVHSPLSKILGNLFLSINKPSYMMKLFTSEVSAMKWLKHF